MHLSFVHNNLTFFALNTIAALPNDELLLYILISLSYGKD